MTAKNKVLVSAGSKHGATAEIARRLGRTLESEGYEVAVIPPGDVDEIESYDAFVLGSAVYAGHWTEDAKQLAARVGDLAAQRPVWVFSSGPIGDPPKPEEDPVDV
ncbi:MAG: flavodoxin, partial [Akkermansiaceae bacterium]|nr:flavodoxin [Akkermansiaceae bacterium]